MMTKEEQAARARAFRATPEGKERTRLQNERRKEAIRAWHKKNRERRAEHRAKWDAKNRTPDYVAYLNHRSRTRRIGAEPVGVTPKEWEQIFEFFGGRCAYCLGPANERDHVQPLSKGGSDDASNVVPCCSRCNGCKHTKTLTEWMMRPSKLERAEGKRRMF